MTDTSEWPYIDLEGAAFEQLLKELEEYLVGDPPECSVALDELRSTVAEAILWYDAERYTAFDVSRRNLHEIGEPLTRVIELLKNTYNQPDIFFALAGNRDRHSINLELALERYEALLRDLDKIALAVPSPCRRERRRPPKIALRLLVGHLANYWVCATGKRFTQDWENGEPLTSATEFVRAVVRFVDPKSLPALPNVTEWVVRERLKGNVMGWFGDEGRRAADPPRGPAASEK